MLKQRSARFVLPFEAAWLYIGGLPEKVRSNTARTRFIIFYDDDAPELKLLGSMSRDSPLFFSNKMAPHVRPVPMALDSRLFKRKMANSTSTSNFETKVASQTLRHRRHPGPNLGFEPPVTSAATSANLQTKFGGQAGLRTCHTRTRNPWALGDGGGLYHATRV